MKRADKFYRNMILTALLALFMFGGVFVALGRQHNIRPLVTNGADMIGLGILGTAVALIYLMVTYEAHKGLKHAVTLYRISGNVKRSLFDAGFVLERRYGDRKLGKIPKIIVDLSEDMMSGRIFVENNPKWHKGLEELFMAAALPGDYIVTRHWLSDNSNRFIFEFEEANIEQTVLHTAKDFMAFAKRCLPYELAVDDRYRVAIHHYLIVAQTGAGKSYFLYCLILQIILKEKSWDIYIADPKRSGVYAIGQMINKHHTAADIDDIIILIEHVWEVMTERMKKFYQNVSGKIDSDYRDFGMTPIVLMIDEFSVLQSSLVRKDKATRDKINGVIGNIIRAGRQVGVFLIIAQQQTNATNLSTEFKENMPFKLILGNAERQTYMTALGQIPENAERKFEPGQGLLVYPGISTVDHPVMVNVPKIDFEIADAVRSIIGREQTPGM